MTIVGGNAGFGDALSDRDRVDIDAIFAGVRAELDPGLPDSMEAVLRSLVGMPAPLLLLHGEGLGPAAIAAHAGAAVRMALRVGLKLWGVELMNEPNLAGVTPIDARTRCLAGLAAVRAEGFAGPVFGGCASNTNDEGLAYMQAMGWATLPADLRPSIHSYAPSNRPGGWFSGGPRAEIAAATAACAGRVPIVTETGFHTAKSGWWIFRRGLSNLQAATAIDARIRALADAGVERVDVYQINNGPTQAWFDRYGVREFETLTWLPQAHVVQRLARDLSGDAQAPEPVPDPTRYCRVSVFAPEGGLVALASGTLRFDDPSWAVVQAVLEDGRLRFELPAAAVYGWGVTLGATDQEGASTTWRVSLAPDIDVAWPAKRPKARRGIVRLSGRAFVDDDGGWIPLATTLFWAMGRWRVEADRVRANIRWAREHGIDVIRILGSVGPSGMWADRSVDPRATDYEQVLGEVIDCAYDEGCRVKITLEGGGPDHDPVAAAQRVVAVVTNGRRHKVLALEAVNEDNADPLQEVAEAVARVFAAAGIPYAVGLGDRGIETIKESTRRVGAPLACYHAEREDGDNGARQARQGWNMKNTKNDDGFEMAVDDGEGPGPGSSVASYARAMKNAVKRACSAICGAGMTCHHTGDGVYGVTYQGPTGPRYANLGDRPATADGDSGAAIADAVSHATDRIPADVANWRQFNTDLPFDVKSGAVNKIYGADAGDGRKVLVVIGCETPVVFVARETLSARFWNPATGEPAGESGVVNAGTALVPTVALWGYVVTVNF